MGFADYAGFATRLRGAWDDHFAGVVQHGGDFETTTAVAAVEHALTAFSPALVRMPDFSRNEHARAALAPTHPTGVRRCPEDQARRAAARDCSDRCRGEGRGGHDPDRPRRAEARTCWYVAQPAMKREEIGRDHERRCNDTTDGGRVDDERDRRRTCRRLPIEVRILDRTPGAAGRPTNPADRRRADPPRYRRLRRHRQSDRRGR